MRCVAIALVLICSSATAAPVLVTKNNYKSAADSPFDLAGGGFYLEDFEDGAVNAPGLSVLSLPGHESFRIVGPSEGGESVEQNGRAIEPANVSSDLNDQVFTELIFTFDDKALGGLPSQVGFVVTDAAILPNVVWLTYFTQQGGGGRMSTQYTNPFTFLGIQSTSGVSQLEVAFWADAGPTDPFFQVDHVQYGAIVPEPSSAFLLMLGGLAFGIRRMRGRATATSIAAIRPSTRTPTARTTRTGRH